MADVDIPVEFTRRYAMFCQQLEEITDADMLGAEMVKLLHMFMKMSASKVPVPPSWAFTHAQANERYSALRHRDMMRRMQ